MSLINRRQTPEAYELPVLDTLHSSGLDLAHSLVVGSAVMALENIRAAHDVDVMVHPDEFSYIMRNQGNGVFTTVPTHIQSLHPVLKGTADHLPLSLDIITTWGPRADKLFERALDEGEVSIHGLRHLSLDQIRYRKDQSHRLKDRLDVRRIDRHMKALRTS